MARKWRNFRKVELHRHLEGALRLSTIRDILIESGSPLPAWKLDELANFVQVRQKMKDLRTLLDCFEITRSALSTPKILERIAFEAVEDAHNEGKGVSFMEHQNEWHGSAPSVDQLQKALKELGA